MSFEDYASIKQDTQTVSLGQGSMSFVGRLEVFTAISVLNLLWENDTKADGYQAAGDASQLQVNVTVYGLYFCVQFTSTVQVHF